MKQTNATFLVDDGVLMADQNQVISLVKARVIVEPIGEPSAYDAEKRAEETFLRIDKAGTDAEKRVEETFRRMDKAATRLMRWFIAFAIVYTVLEIANAFAVHAVPGWGK